MRKKRQYKPDELPEHKHARFLYNLKNYYLSHQEVVEAVEGGHIPGELKERFKNDYISVIAAYASAAHSYELDHAWKHGDEQTMKQEIEDSMKEFRKSVIILKHVDEVSDDRDKGDRGKSKRFTKRVKQV
jgi:hypothetical protein